MRCAGGIDTGDTCLSDLQISALKTINTDTRCNFVLASGETHYPGCKTTFNVAWDSLTAMENWSEKPVSPTNEVVANTAGIPGRTRPLCDYPKWAKYNDSGDVNLAAFFTCAN